MLKDLKSFDLISNESLRLLAGNYTRGDDVGGFEYRLDSIGAFERLDFSDLNIGENGMGVTEQGKVKLDSKRQLEFVSSTRHLMFDVFVFDTFTFLVNSEKAKDFQRDFASAVSAFSKKSIYKLDDQTYTAKFMIAFFLHNKYLVKGLTFAKNQL